MVPGAGMYGCLKTIDIKAFLQKMGKFLLTFLLTFIINTFLLKVFIRIINYLHTTYGIREGV